MGKKIAHIVLDEKFVDNAYHWFEKVLPNSNDFFIPSKVKALNYIKKTPVEAVGRLCFLNKKFINRLKCYDLIVLHSLTPAAVDLVNKLAGEVKFLWVGFGFDYYEYIGLDLLKPITEGKADFLSGNRLSKVERLKSIALRVARKGESNELKKKAISRIDYFSPVLPTEYNLVKSGVNIHRFPKHVRWNYGSQAGVYRSLDYTDCNNNSILIGNSASITNNHFDIIELLKKCELEERKVICPLNYGNSELAKSVCDYGNKILGKSFEPVVDFMEINEYYKKISLCSHAVFGNIRQEGSATVAMSIYSGCLVFLDINNPLYSYYKMEGVKLLSLQELEENKKLINHKLTKFEKDINREIVAGLSSIDVCIEKTKKIVNMI